MENNYKSGGWKKWVWIYVVIAIVLYGGIYYYYKNNNSSSTGGGLYGATTPTPTASASAVSGAVVSTKTSSSVGQYLADSSGKTLYTYGGDTSGVSNCTGSCIADWPIYAASSTSALPANVTVITRSDGSTQYAYKGMPLYYFTGDSQAGQVNGDGLSDFHAAKP